jgi:adenylosuccinate lyase
MIPRYSPPDIAEIWTEKWKYDTWFEIELSALRAMEHHKMIPKGTTKSVEKAINVIDIEAIKNLEKELRHDVLAFVTYLERQAGPVGRWIHYGMTSSDIVDTALALQIDNSMNLVLARTALMTVVLKEKIKKHASTRIMGRTHGVHAEPTTLGYVFAGHLEEIERSVSRLYSAADFVAVGKLSGAVGTHAHIPEEVEYHHLKSLGLKPELFATQVVSRDRHANLITSIALLATSLERLMVNIRHYHRTEVGEVLEAFGESQRGSSAMPHKQNPIGAENLCGIARLLRSYVHPAMEDMILWHERDISHSSVERVIIPDAICLIGYMLDKSFEIIRDLKIDPERMKQNIENHNGQYLTGGVLLHLIWQGMPREKAYLAIKSASHAETAYHFISVLLENKSVSKITNRTKLKSVMAQKQNVAVNKLKEHYSDTFRPQWVHPLGSK